MMTNNKRSFTSKVRVLISIGLFSLSAAAAMLALAQGQSNTSGTSAPSWSGPVPHAPVVVARSDAMMAYDEARGQIVLFGGAGCPDTSSTCLWLNDTWTWDGSSWTQQHPTTSPPGRSVASMVYDAAHKKVVLFGGTAGGQVLGDTWTWDGSNWTEEKPQSSPPARFAASIAYDAARGETVLFGGENCSVTCIIRIGFNDTWVWNGATWTQKVTVASPPPKTQATMAYDAARSNIVLFGGTVERDVLPSADTWTWNGSTWTQQTPATPPPARTGATMAYDAARGNMILFGGEDGNNNLFNDSWIWDGTEWTQKMAAITPDARKWASMAYDITHAKVVLFGGFYPELNDTWTWDGAAWAEVPRVWPPAGYTWAVAYDAASRNDVILIEAGSGDAGETWIWNGTTWIQQHPAISPPGRSWNGMAYHAGTKSVVLFGGSKNVYYGDTWTWDGLNWTEQRPAASPSARWGHMMAHDVTGKVVLFGGNDGGCRCPVNDTWTWDGVTWTQQRPATSPPARGYTNMAYEPATGQVVLFGGYDRTTGNSLGDTWTWDGGNWTEQHPVVSPSPRVGASLATDPSTGHVLLFGGAASGAINPGMSNEVWLWDGSTWTLQHPAGDGPPAPRWFVSLAEHPATGTVVMFGGQIGNPGNPTDQTWIWSSVASPGPLSAVVSRKIHGSAGTFDISLPLTGTPGVECRKGGANGDYTMVFKFANTLTSVGGASVTSGTGTVSSSAMDSSDAHNYIVNLTGVTNAQTITVSLSNVNDSAGNSSASVSASMGILLGDTSGDGVVNSADITQTKSQSGQFVTTSNFREDVTVNGSLNSADISLVKSKSGTALPQ